LPGTTFFFFTAPPTTCIYTLSLHDALPILRSGMGAHVVPARRSAAARALLPSAVACFALLFSAANSQVQAQTGTCADAAEQSKRSEEHTSELQSRENLVCRLLLEKKKNNSV